MKKKSILSLLIAVVMLLSMFAGCGNTEESMETSNSASATTTDVKREEAPTEAAESAEEVSESVPAEEYGECAISFPLDETETLTYWHDVDSRILTYIPTGVIDDAPAFVAAEEATNVHIKHVGVGMDLSTVGMMTDNFHSVFGCFCGGVR